MTELSAERIEAKLDLVAHDLDAVAVYGRASRRLVFVGGVILAVLIVAGMLWAVHHG